MMTCGFDSGLERETLMQYLHYETWEYVWKVNKTRTLVLGQHKPQPRTGTVLTPGQHNGLSTAGACVYDPDPIQEP